MKLILLSDVHLTNKRPISRKDSFPEVVFKKLEWIFQFAEREHAVILQAGDFFDFPRSWHLLNQTFSLLSDYYETLLMYVIYGQHDQYYRADRNATMMGVLIRNERLCLLGSEPHVIDTHDDSSFFLYGCSFGDEIPVVKDPNAFNILVIHRPILMSVLYPGMTDYNYAPQFLKTHKDYNLILAGDIHRQFCHVSEDKRIICNAGPLVRDVSEDYMFEHQPGFYLYNTETSAIEFIVVPHADAEEVLDAERLQKEKEKSKMFDSFISGVTESQITFTSFTDNLTAVVKEAGVEDSVVKILSDVMEDKDE